MFNKEVSIKCSEVQALRGLFPEATFNDMIKLKKRGTIEDIIECKGTFPEASVKDVQSIVGGRNFMRWYKRNAKVINILALATPGFAMALFGIAPGSFALSLFSTKAIVAYSASSAIPSTAMVAYSTLPSTVPAISNVAVAAGSTVQTSFFGGKGAILLHMLVVGFFTLVVSSFLKFTGRGDLIPLVAFVGGGIILYEVIGLFGDIYGSIKTLLQM